jgi:hypothetical protein
MLINSDRRECSLVLYDSVENLDADCLLQVLGVQAITSASFEILTPSVGRALLHLQKDLNQLPLPDKNLSPIGWIELAKLLQIILSQSCATFWNKAVFIVTTWTSHLQEYLSSGTKGLVHPSEDKLWQLHVKGQVHVPETKPLPHVKILSHFRVLQTACNKATVLYS